MILSTSLAAASFTQAASKSCSLPVSAATSTAGAGGGVLQPASAISNKPPKQVNPVLTMTNLIPISDGERKGPGDRPPCPLHVVGGGLARLPRRTSPPPTGPQLW